MPPTSRGRLPLRRDSCAESAGQESNLQGPRGPPGPKPGAYPPAPPHPPDPESIDRFERVRLRDAGTRAGKTRRCDDSAPTGRPSPAPSRPRARRAPRARTPRRRRTAPHGPARRATPRTLRRRRKRLRAVRVVEPSTRPMRAPRTRRASWRGGSRRGRTTGPPSSRGEGPRPVAERAAERLDDSGVELRACVRGELRQRLLYAVGAPGGHRREGVAGGDDP